MYLAEILVPLWEWVDPGEMERIGGVFARLTTELIDREENINYFHLHGLSAMCILSAYIASPRYAHRMANVLCSRSPIADEYGGEGISGILKAMLGPHAVSSRETRINRLMAASLQFGVGGTIAMTIHDAFKPAPCRLNSQELIELLKMPTCFGATRRVVLDQLGNIHGRRFVNHWEFVRFAKEKGLKLDLTSPPRRPDPNAPLGRLPDDSAMGR